VLETSIRIAKLFKIDRLLKILRLYKPCVAVLQHISAWQWGKLGEWQWERRAKRLYSQFITRGDIAFDVGANRGSRVPVFRELGATVVAVEPQQNCIDILRRKFNPTPWWFWWLPIININRNHPQVFTEQVALGSMEGEAEMVIQDSDDGKSTLSKEFMEVAKKSAVAKAGKWSWDHKITVKVKTLDMLISKYGCPTFCKIDVEGFEYEVLMGLSTSIPAVSIEFHTVFFEACVKCIERLNSLGFTDYNYSIGESMVLSLPKWVEDKEIVAIISDMSHRLVQGDIYARRSNEKAQLA